METRRDVSVKHRLQPHDSCVEDSKAIITYQIEEETGALTQISVSPNKNHITARVVSSPHDVASNVYGSEFRLDRSGVPVLKQYEHIPTSYYTGDGLPSFVNTPFVIMGKEIRHPKVKGRLWDHPLSDTEINQRKQPFAEVDYVRGHHRSDGTSSRDKASVRSGDFKTGKHSKAARPKNIIDSAKSHKQSASTESHGSDFNILEDRSVKKVKPTKLTTQIKDKLDTIYRDSDKRYKHLPSSDPRDGELKGHGPTDRHVLSTLLDAVPGTANVGSSQTSQENTGHRKTNQKHKRHYQTDMLPRYGSLDSMSQFYTQPSYQGNLTDWNTAPDPANSNGQCAYLGDDGRVYYQNWAGYYPYSDNYWTYPSWRCDSGTSRVPGHGDLGVTAITSGDDTSEEEVVERATKGKIKTKARMQDQTKSDTFRQHKQHNNNLRKSVPLHTHKSPRSKLYKSDVRSHLSAESKPGNRRSMKERSSNFTDDLKAREKESKDSYSDKSTSINTSDQQMGYQNTSPNNKKHEPKRQHNENRIAPPQRIMDNNFTLSSDPNSVSGFPRSATPGHLDQILRNTNLNLATMRRYLDAMSMSLASIPAATSGNVQRQGDHTGDTLEDVEHLEFFKSPNQTTTDKRTTGLSQFPVPDYAKSDRKKDEQNGFTTLDSCSVITDYLDGPSDWKKKNISSLHIGRDRTYEKSITADIYPRSAVELEQLESRVVGSTSDRTIHETDVGDVVRATVPCTSNVTSNNRRQQSRTSRLLSSASSDSRQLPLINSSKIPKKDTAIQTDFDTITTYKCSFFLTDIPSWKLEISRRRSCVELPPAHIN